MARTKRLFRDLFMTGLMLPLVAAAQQSPQVLPGSGADVVAYEAGEAGPHHRLWGKVVERLDPATGKIVRTTNDAFIELATGLNVRNAAGAYEPADPSFTITPEGYAFARNAQHKVRISPLLADADGAVQITMPDGRPLSVSPSALVLSDRASGRRFVLGEVTNTVGSLVAPNVVLFTNVLGPEGFRASIRMVNELGAFHSDVVLHERLDVNQLQQAGFDPETSEIQIWSTIVEAPPPNIEQRVVYRESSPAIRAQMHEPDVINDDLDWGAFRMPMGRAYLFDGQRQIDQSVDVFKRWVEADGERFLVEKIPLSALQPLFAQLAPPTRPLDLESQETFYAQNWRPRPWFRENRGETILLAENRSQEPDRPELILDWTTVASQPNHTFQGDKTYYVSGSVSLTGTTTIEGGTVIKYNNTASARISVYGPIDCLTDAYRPAMFTSKFDNSVGETVATGTPATYGGSALYLYLPSVGPSVTFSNLQVAYANIGIDVSTDQGGTLTLRNVRFVNCTTAVKEGGYYNYPNVNIYNGLIHNATTAFSVWYGGNLTAQHLTVNNCGALAVGQSIQYGPSFNFANSIFASVNSLTSGGIYLSGQHNGFYLTQQFGNPAFPAPSGPPFQTVAAGAHYLANNDFRDKGTTAGIDSQLLNESKERTTYPPVELANPITSVTTLPPQVPGDTDQPDLGWHYDPLDYLLNQVDLSASLTLADGVAVGVSGAQGLKLLSGANVSSEGTPTKMNRIVRYTAAQEQPVNLGAGYFIHSANDAYGEISLRFTDFALGQGGTRTLVSCSGAKPFAQLFIRDCRLRNVYLSVYVDSDSQFPPVAAVLENNLIEDSKLYFYQHYYGADSCFSLAVRNNLLRRGIFYVTYFYNEQYYSQNPAWWIQDNLFDGALQTLYTGGGSGYEWESYVTRSHNGFTTGTANNLGGSYDKTGLAPDFQTGPLGDFYYLPGGSLSQQLIDAGSRSASVAGLYHHTVKTSNVKEGDEPPGAGEPPEKVDIGFHYVAVDGNGNPTDTDGDGLGDYFEDRNGDGTRDAGESSITEIDTDGDGLTDFEEAKVFGTVGDDADSNDDGVSDSYEDLDNDGLTNIEELKAGTDPAQPNVAAPAFSPVGGSYAAAQNVVVTCPTAAATIHYTLNGNEPTESDPTVSSGSTLAINNNLTLKARAWKTGWIASETESQSYRIEAVPSNEAPDVTVLPDSGSFLAADSIEILVEAADSDGTIAKVQLYRGSFKVAETTSSPLRHSLDTVPAGTYIFTAKAIDDSGAVTLSSPITITISDSGPVVSLIGAQPFFTSSPGTLLANIVGVNPGALTTLTLNGAPIFPRTGAFPLTVTLVEGENEFTLVATDDQSQSAQATIKVYLDSVLPVVSITAPANNSTFGTDRVNVSGTFTEASLNRITVNGVPAFIDGNTFEALNVSLAEGANTITATAEDIAGNEASATINVTGGANPVDPVQLSANPVGGFASLNVTLTPVNNAPGTLQQVLYDFNGDNVTDQTVANLSPVAHNYATAGEYFPVVTIQTSVGRFSSLGGWNAWNPDRLRINVQSPPVQESVINVTDPIDLKTTAAGHLYILSRSTATITQYDANDAVVRSKATIGSTPTGLDVDAAGNVYVALSGDHQVAKLNPNGSTFQLDTSFDGDGLIGGSGTGNSQFNTPYDVAVSPDGQEIVVSDSGNHRIQRFNAADGTFLETFGTQGSGVGQFNTPKGLAYDGLGYLYIIDSGNNRVVLTLLGAFLGTSGSSGTALGQFQSAMNLGVGSRGIYVADAGNNRVQAFDPIAGGHGASSTPFNSRLAISTQLGLSQPAAVAPAANLLEEEIYIADTANDRVIKTTLPQTTTPEATWNSMKASVLASDIDAAIPYFASASAEGYRQLFLSIGVTELVSAMSQVPAITPVVIESVTAQYRFEQVIEGITISFPIDFVKENGTWKIAEY